jgi:hypothetical protein
MLINQSSSRIRTGNPFLEDESQNIKKVVNEQVIFFRKLREEINFRILL